MELNGLICAYLMDKEGGANKLDWKAIEQWKPVRGPLWLHFDYTNPKAAGLPKHKVIATRMINTIAERILLAVGDIIYMILSTSECTLCSLKPNQLIAVWTYDHLKRRIFSLSWKHRLGFL